MKKSTIGQAVTLGILAIASHAQAANNSVTLYGIIDTGLQYVNNSGGQGQSALSMSTGNQVGSRWGLRGGEDLGGGLSTVFKLESGFNSTNGESSQGGRLFGRTAMVGLSSNTWGTLTLGRQYDALFDLVQQTQGDGFLGGFFSASGDVDDADNSIRFNNAVKWSSPDWNGLTAVAHYAFGGVAGAISSGQTYSAAAAYAKGPLTVAGGYMHIDNGNTAAQRGNSTADSIFNSSVNQAYESASKIDIVRAGANVTVGQFILGGYYSHSQYNADQFSAFQTAEKYDNYSVYAVWNVAPDLATEVGYNFMKSSGDSSATRNQLGLAVDYNLSKRTDVYGVVAWANANGSDGMGKAQAVIGSTSIDAGANSQTLVTVGLRHKF
jgi:predicted porin